MPTISKDRKDTAKKAFLKAYASGYSVSGAAAKAKIGVAALYRWKRESIQFAKEWEEAWEARGDWYEDRNRDAAAQLNMAAILNGLKIHKRIVDRQEVTGDGGKPIQHQHSGSLTAEILAEAAHILQNIGTNGHANGSREP